MFTQITLVGHLGADPELRYLDSGNAVCNFSLATSHAWVDAQGERQKVTTWWRIAVFGKQAESCNLYLAKGSRCLVAGDKVEARGWVSQDTGEVRTQLQLTARQVQFLSSRTENEAGEAVGAEAQQQATEPNAAPREDIPF